MSACVNLHTCITQVTLKTINTTLLIYNWWLFFLSCLVLVQLSSSQTQAGWWCILLGSDAWVVSSQYLLIEVWSLNSKTTWTGSSVSLAGDKSCCWSQNLQPACCHGNAIYVLVTNKRLKFVLVTCVLPILCPKGWRVKNKWNAGIKNCVQPPAERFLKLLLYCGVILFGKCLITLENNLPTFHRSCCYLN